ncbi:MAG: DUF2892 domain-containing protein [Planctomycetes bacterium]|nr:DUF2892 domain-containing protein [Planctomycetota bacterium]
MGTIDRVIRTTIAVVIIALYLAGQISGTLAIILAIITIAFLTTSAIGFCPVYTIVGISTLKEGQAK